MAIIKIKPITDRTFNQRQFVSEMAQLTVDLPAELKILVDPPCCLFGNRYEFIVEILVQEFWTTEDRQHLLTCVQNCFERASGLSPNLVFSYLKTITVNDNAFDEVSVLVVDSPDRVSKPY